MCRERYFSCIFVFIYRCDGEIGALMEQTALKCSGVFTFFHAYFFGQYRKIRSTGDYHVVKKHDTVNRTRVVAVGLLFVRQVCMNKWLAKPPT